MVFLTSSTADQSTPVRITTIMSSSPSLVGAPRALPARRMPVHGSRPAHASPSGETKNAGALRLLRLRARLPLLPSYARRPSYPLGVKPGCVGHRVGDDSGRVVRLSTGDAPDLGHDTGG